jgi:serine/threonine protein kinase
MPSPRPDPQKPTRTARPPAVETVSTAQTGGGDTPADGPVPATVGPYRVLGVLGRGGMGAVYRAEEPALKRQVAVKVMLPALAANPQAKARFLREAQAQARVEHDHIIPIYRVGEADGVPFLVMPLLKGRTLADALNQNRRPALGEAVRVARQMADGLAAAHEKGLVHRDIKPGNVWLEGDRRRVKILDFGLARAVTDSLEPLTRDGVIMGTPSYMAPEQARGLPVDFRADLFSLGVVLYQMTTGVLPFAGADMYALLYAVVTDDPPPPAAVYPTVPPALSELVMRLLAKEPAGRPESAAAVVAELRRIEATLSQVVPSLPAADNPFADLAATTADAPAPSRPARPDRRRPLWPYLAGLAATLFAIAAVAFQLFIRTPHGTLVIESDDPAVEVRVTKDGATLVDRTQKREIELTVGKYGIALVEPKGGLRLTTDKFEIVKNGKATVTVRRDPPAGPSAEPKESTPRPTPVPGRVAAEWVLAAGGTVAGLDRDGRPFDTLPGTPLPAGPVRVTTVRLAGRKTVGDADLGRLAGLPDLSALVLTGTEVTDAGLLRLAEFPALSWVNVRDTAVTVAGVTTFIARRPGCQLAWDKPPDPVPPPTPPPVAAGPPAEKPPEPAPPKVAAKPPTPPAKTGREAAQLLNPHWDLTVLTPAGELVTVPHGRPLPAGRFDVVKLHDDLPANAPALPDGYAADVFLPAVAGCPNLRAITGVWGHLFLSPDESARLLALPCARKLAELTGLYIAFTPATADALRKCTQLTELAVSANTADDALIARLGAFRGLRVLWVNGVGGTPRSGKDGLVPVAKLPVWMLGLQHAKGITPKELQAVAANPAITDLNLAWAELSDTDVRHLTGAVGLKKLFLDGTGLTDAAVPDLLRIPGLDLLNVTGTKITADGAKRLARGRPGCIVIRDGKTVEP